MLIKSDSPKPDIFYSLKISSAGEEMKQIPLEADEIVLGGGGDVDIAVAGASASGVLQFTRTPHGYSVKSLSHGALLNEQKIEQNTPLTPEDTLSLNGVSIQLSQTSREEEENKKKQPEAKAKDAGKTQFMQVFTVEELETKGRLVGVSGSVKGRIFDMMKDKLSVGRDPSNDICIESDGLSRAHAVIEVGDGSLTVMDFNSTNGTFVNGKKVVSDTVKPGSIIQFANAGLRYEGPEGKGERAIAAPADSRHTVRMAVFAMVIAVILGGGFLAGYRILMQKQKKATEELAAKKKELETLASVATSVQKNLSVAEQALNGGQYEEALSIVQGILQKHPGEAAAVLLRGKIEKQQKNSGVKAVFEKGSRYFEGNDFERAKMTLSSIEPDFPQYDEVKTMLQQLEQLGMVETAHKQALKDFSDGKLDAVRSSLEFIFKRLPVYKKAHELKTQVDIVDSCLKSIEKTEAGENTEEMTRHLKLILQTVSGEDNFFHQFAEKKLKSLKTGKNLKTETSYAAGIALFADHKHLAAYDLLKKTLALDPDQIKVKIALSEVKGRRDKILEQWNKLALILDAEDPAKAKLIWKKIMDAGPDENSYYQAAVGKLGS